MGRVKDLAIDEANEERRKRGARSNTRGKSFEREVAGKLGEDAKRTGQFGGKTDVEAPWIQIQCKLGNGYFPTRLDNALRAINPKGDQLRAVVVGNRPETPGVKRTTLIVLNFEQFVAWFGGRNEETINEE
jgi:hypothetical protein